MAKRRKIVGTKISDRYRITGEIGVGGMGQVFRAMPFADPSEDVAIKVILKREGLGPEDLLRFQKEAALMSRLYHPNIVSFHELGILPADDRSVLGGGYYIVMDIASGKNLKESLSGDKRKDIAFLLEIGLQISSALDYTHGKNIIHRDIKPQNIVVGSRWQEQGVLAKVLDFGVARIAEVAQYSATDEDKDDVMEDAAGTPLYMAPEQTPLMTAPIDHRVDLYSLGCVLYEVLAGRPPFQGNSRNKLMRQHVAEEPEPLRSIRPNVPEMIELIINKLLAKHPSSRYQTAFGLHADLKRVKRMIEENDHSIFPLGLNDGLQAVSAQLNMVGRDRDLEKLIDNFNKVAEESGRSRLTVIKGESGIGKSRLLSDFRSYLVKRKVRYISTRFSRHESSLPYNALANGFNEYLMRVMNTQEHETEEIKRRVKTLLGPMATKVANVVPGLNPYLPENIQDQSPDDLDEEDNAHDQSFIKAFSDFTRCLATDNNPVVFIFDDMHWADEGSIDLINDFFSHNNSLKFHLLISYSPLHSVKENTSFQNFLRKFSKLKRRFEEVDLKNLDYQAISKLAGDTLNSANSINEDLTNYLYEQSGGNPMYAVELIRALIADELISYDQVSKLWKYDLDEILNRPPILESIDLTLIRIKTIPMSQRDFLEIAATVGMNFAFEELLIKGRDIGFYQLEAKEAMDNAVRSGLIVKTSGSNESELGQNYSFSHKRARELILDTIPPTKKRELHLQVALRIETMFKTPGTKALFTLAHHINQYLDGKVEVDEELAIKSFNYNREAGLGAEKSGSYAAAESYFERAFTMLKSLPRNAEVNIDLRMMVLEKLADMASLQLDNKAAIDKYRTMFKMGLEQPRYQVVTYKMNSLLLFLGQLSAARKELFKALDFVELKRSDRLLDVVSMYLLLAADCFLPVKKTPAYRLLHRLKSERSDWSIGNEVDDIIHLGQDILIRENMYEGLKFHHLGYLKSCQNEGLIENQIRSLGDRAILLGFLNFRSRAFKVLEPILGLLSSEDDSDLYSYLVLQRALVIDYARGRYEETWEGVSIALNGFSFRDRSSMALGKVYQLYHHLMAAHVSEANNMGKRVPQVIPTRNWLSPKAFAFYLFNLLLQGSRDSIVAIGESWLNRRREVGGRPQDIFSRIIQAILTFSKGQGGRSHNFYGMAAEQYLKGAKAGFLYPFENDFVAFFLLTFPFIYERENRRDLIVREDQIYVLKKIMKRKSSGRKVSENIRKLLEARYQQLIYGKKIPDTYDAALRYLKSDNEHRLLQWFGFLWFGHFMLGKGVTKRKDYILKVRAEASESGYHYMVDMAENILSEYSVDFEPIFSHKKKMMRREKGHKISEVVLSYLKYTVEENVEEKPMEDFFSDTVEFLRRFYDFQRCNIILLGDNDGDIAVNFLEKNKPWDEKVVQYLKPYLSLRSTLFLPVTDAPWNHSSDMNNEVSASTSVGISDAIRDTNPDLHTTQIIPNDTIESGPPRQLKSSRKSETYPSNSHQASQSEKTTSRRIMNAMVPVRSGDINVGLLYLEDVEIKRKDTVSYSRELNQFGAQVALNLSRKTVYQGPEGSYDFIPFNQASYYLEDVSSWLSIWKHGQLRERRESSWYLGFNLGDDHYLLVYCRLNGAEAIRHDLSAQIWFYLQMIRGLALVGGKNTLTISELRAELSRFIVGEEKFQSLEGISLSFTIFDRVQKCVTSGHYGPSRPYVLKTANHVIPHNDPVLYLNNGRTLRYWTISASMSMLEVYLLPHNSSGLELIQEVRDEVGLSYSQEMSPAEVEEMLINELHAENVPRYYVGVIMAEEKGEPLLLAE